MEAIQEELKRRREECGLSLEDLSGETNIAVRYLKAIEEGDFDVLPRPYTRMFLKAYGVRVGMDAESVLRRFDEMMAPEEEHVRKRAGEPIGRSVFPTRRLMIAGGIVLVVVVGIFSVLRFGIRERRVPRPPASLETSRQMPLERASMPGPVASEQSVEGEGDSVRTVEEEPALEEKSFAPFTEPPELEKQAAADSILVLEGEAREEIWLSVRADGRLKCHRLIKAGERERWEAKDRFEVRLGKPKGIALTFQGEMLDNTAWHKVPIDLVFSREGVEIVDKMRRSAGTPAPVDSVGGGD